MHYYQLQVQIENTSANLFKEIQVIHFDTDQKICPLDSQNLHVQKTYTRLIKSIGLGQFYAHTTVRYCKAHPELGLWKSKELDEIVPPDSNIAYNVIVEIGKLRFIENRQVIEIQWLLFIKHSIEISISEIELLIDKFIFYLAAVHQESVPLIRAEIQAQGGYILHIDATCEGDSPKLVSSVDPVSGFVLYSAKITSENQEELTHFLEQIKANFGVPHVIVSDMSKAIKSAVTEVFGNLPHYICHFHFLAAIGKLLFEKEHIILRKALSKAGVSGKLKAMKRNMTCNFEKLKIDEIEAYLEKPGKLEKTAEATEMLAYYLIQWILDHPSEGNGYGFPFDQRYLNFYERLEQAQLLLENAKAYYSTKTENDAIIWKLYHIFQKIVGDSSLKKTALEYKTKLDVFQELRQALCVAPESTNKGLKQNDEAISNDELDKIKNAVEDFIKKHNDRIDQTTEKSLRNGFIQIKERILKYWDRLFADPFVVDVNGEKKVFFIHRTNNIMEQLFRRFAYFYRRIHGNSSIRRNLENIPEALPLVENLKNHDYVKLVFCNENKIDERFSQIDVKKIRKMLVDHRSDKKMRKLTINKKMLRHPQFKEKLSLAFAAVAT